MDVRAAAKSYWGSLRMNTGMWFFGLIMAFGVILIAGKISPQITNGILLLVLIGIILSRWVQIAPLTNLIGRVAGGEGPKKK